MTTATGEPIKGALVNNPADLGITATGRNWKSCSVNFHGKTTWNLELSEFIFTPRQGVPFDLHLTG